MKEDVKVKNIKSLFGIILLAILTIMLIENPLSNQYLSKLKEGTVYIYADQSDLYNQIVLAAKDYSIKPQDAKIDKIWKTIPGYNGMKVDTKASYNNMKKDRKFDKNKLVFKQVPPKVHLQNLPASPIYRGNPDKPMVSFLINVAWGNEYLPKMLKTLKKYNIHATFFLEGRWTQNNPELAKMIVEDGNEVGNHSFTHPDMKTLTSNRIREELIKTNQVIEATTGQKKVKWFAPPSGSYRSEVVDIADSMGMGTIMWSVDTIDWQKPEPETIVSRVMTKVHPGALILMHPTDSTAKALEKLVIEIKKKQFRIGTVSKLVDEERIIKK
jgi:peptidoglycan-N-acetylglucosamine deacetylase